MKADIELGGPPPVATVTLAEIYATQGHYDKALRMLDEVLEREPDHAQALASRKRLLEEREHGPGRRRRSEPAVVEVAPPPAVPAVPAVAAAREPVEATPEPAAVAAAPEPVEATPEPAAVEAAPEPARAAIVAEAVVEAAVEAVAQAAAVAEVAAEAVAEAAAETVADAAEVADRAAAADVGSALADEATAPAPSNGEPALVVLHTAERAFIYWRLPALSDSLRLRSVTVRPAAHGATIEEEDHRLTRSVGGFWLPRLAPGTEVRAALGELRHDGFAPVTVARVVDSSSDVAFEPPGVSTDAELEAAARTAAGL